MDTAVTGPTTDPVNVDVPTPPISILIGGLASLGAGAIHAAAIGAHNEHPSVGRTFAILAAAQLAWGAAVVAMARPTRTLMVAGVALHGAAVLGWLLAKTSGIDFVSGMEQSEPVQLADGTAAAFAFVAAMVALRSLFSSKFGDALSPRERLGAAVLPIAAMTVASMLSTGSHSHAGDHDSEHSHEAASESSHADGHGDHGEPVDLGPFDPTAQVDLSGIDGVSAEEQADAEDLVERTLDRLPQFADIASLNSKGFYSIGDSITGDEHYVNWSYVNDDKLLDPDFPESLVIRHENGTQRLVAAMFMLREGATLDDIPAIGGKLLQWHVHADLCLSDDPIKPTLAISQIGEGVATTCGPGFSKRGNVPMVHVWIAPNVCGPFAALSGIGGGQVAGGETVNCHEQHSHVNSEAPTATLPGIASPHSKPGVDLTQSSPEQIEYGLCAIQNGVEPATMFGLDENPQDARREDVQRILAECGPVPPETTN